MFRIYLLIFTLFISCYSDARSNKDKEVSQVYKESVKKMLDSLAVEKTLDNILPLSEKEKNAFKESLSERDSFLYSPISKLKKINKKINVDLRSGDVIEIKLGHTFSTTLIFTDALGNPWSADLLSDISNSGVVSIKRKRPNIFVVKPKTRGGETNIPILLKGQQRPITLLFKIDLDEVYFDVDLVVDGIGDNELSQQYKAINAYVKDSRTLAKLSLKPEISMLLKGITPNGFEERRAYNEYKEELDARDFMAWTRDDKLYILTPYDFFSPEPIDINPSTDGRYKLLVYKKTPVLAVRNNAKVFWLNIE